MTAEEYKEWLEWVDAEGGVCSWLYAKGAEAAPRDLRPVLEMLEQASRLVSVTMDRWGNLLGVLL